LRATSVEAISPMAEIMKVTAAPGKQVTKACHSKGVLRIQYEVLFREQLEKPTVAHVSLCQTSCWTIGS